VTGIGPPNSSPSPEARLRARVDVGYHVANDPHIREDIEWALGEIERLRATLNKIASGEYLGEAEVVASEALL
jgi:hypothetical protein